MIYTGTEIVDGLKRITFRQVCIVAVAAIVPGGLILSGILSKVWKV
jgi:hypothetical protein